MSPISGGVWNVFQGALSSGCSSLSLNDYRHQLEAMMNAASASTIYSSYPQYQDQQYQQQQYPTWPATTLTAAPSRVETNQDWLDQQVEKMRVRL